MHGLNTLKHQPAKIAAIEGIWHTEKSAALTRLDLQTHAIHSHEATEGLRKIGQAEGPE